MVFLAADQQTVFKTVPCLIGGAIDFNFDYGFLIGSSIVFHVDPGPPPYQKFWNYTVSNSVSGLRIDGLVGTATAGCADTPTQFSHTDVLALYIPTPKLNVISFSKDRGAQLFVQGTAGETNVVEASDDLKSWVPINTNVMDYSLCPICPYFSFEDLEERDTNQFEYRLVGSENIDGVDAWKVESTPRQTKVSQYTRSILWIRKDNYALAQIENYSKDQLVRRAHYTDIRNDQGIWTAHQIEMHDLKRNSRTILKIEKLSYSVPMKDDDFTLQSLRRES